MTKVRSTLVLLLLCSWTAVPTLRCLIPTEPLSPEEQACCKAMGGQCGEMGSHPCCKKVQSGTQPAIATAKTSIVHLAVMSVVRAPTTERLSSTTAVYAVAEPDPPPLPGVTTTILRI